MTEEITITEEQCKERVKQARLKDYKALLKVIRKLPTLPGQEPYHFIDRSQLTKHLGFIIRIIEKK